MPFCNNCGELFDWGYDDEHNRWVLLEPIEKHSDLPKSFVDENGVKRADHRDRCGGTQTVNVTRLKKKQPPGDDEYDIGEAQDAIASETGWFERMKGTITR